MKLLDIRSDEIGKLSLCGLMLAVRAAGKAIGWSAVQVFLYKRLGLDSLPYSFVIFALFGMVGSFGYLFFADVIKRERLLHIYCTATGLALLLPMLFAPGMAEATASNPRLIAFCVLVLLANGLGDETIGIQIWTIINDTFTPSQGIRVYPLIATATLLGGLLGGRLLNYLMPVCAMPVLIGCWGLANLMVLPLLSCFENRYGKNADALLTPPATAVASWNRLVTNLKSGAMFAFRSRLVMAVGGICILFWTVASLKEYQYGTIVTQTFPSEIELGRYYAYYTTVLNTAVIVLQLLLTGRILKNIGVGQGLHVLPVTIFTGLVIMFACDTFWAAFVMRFTWDLMAMTLQGSAYQLSFNAIPMPYRGRIRGLLEGVVNPLGGILGGGILLFTKAPTIIAMLALLFSLAWVLVAYFARKHYHRAILENMASKDRRTSFDAQEMLVAAQEIDRDEPLPLLLPDDENERELFADEAPNQGNDVTDSQAASIEFFSVTDLDNRRKLFKKMIWEGGGKLAIYCMKGLGCYQLQVIIHGTFWNIETHKQQLVIEQQGQVSKAFSTVKPGNIYWETESGYVALFWRGKGIHWIEIGNYSDVNVVGVHCKSNGSIHPRKLKRAGKYVNPFSRFAMEVEPLGHLAG